MRLVYTTAAFALIRLLFILLMHLDVGFLKDWGNTVLWGRSSRLRPTKGGGSLNLPPTGSGWSFGWKRTWSFLEPKFYGIRCYSWTHFRELKMQLWKWPVVKYKHIKIKQRICLCLTWTVNANSLKQNFVVTKEICSWLPPWLDEYRRRFCLQKGVSYTACTKKLPHTHYRSAPRVGSGAL